MADWFRIKQLSPNVWHIREPGHVSFYLVREEGQDFLIDSGLGCSKENFQFLKTTFSLDKITICNTHLHCDHIGLNGFVDEVYCSKEEYDKFVCQSEINQIDEYYNELEEVLKWPRDFSITKEKFHSQYEFPFRSNWEILRTPGHTSGHLCFYKKDDNFLFLGDFIYDGAIYLNFPDSNLKTYISSLEMVIDFVKAKNPLLLPSHNSIPLSKDFLFKFYVEIRLQSSFDSLRAKPFTGSPLLPKGVIYEIAGVKVYVKEEDLKKL